MGFEVFSFSSLVILVHVEVEAVWGQLVEGQVFHSSIIFIFLNNYNCSLRKLGPRALHDFGN